MISTCQGKTIWCAMSGNERQEIWEGRGQKIIIIWTHGVGCLPPLIQTWIKCKIFSSHQPISHSHALPPTSQTHALIYTGFLDCAVPEWQCYHDATAVSRQGQLVEIPLISSLSALLCLYPPNPLPLPQPGWSGLLLLTALHKCPRRNTRKREGEKHMEDTNAKKDKGQDSTK